MTVDVRPNVVDVHVRPGDDIAFRVLVISQANGTLKDFTGATLAGVAGAQTLTVSSPAAGQISVSMTDTATSSMGVGSWPWSVTSTVGATTTTVVTGSWEASTSGTTERAVIGAVVV